MAGLRDISYRNRVTLCEFTDALQFNRSSQGAAGANRKLALGTVGKLKGVEGVSSFCRDEDFQPPLASESGGKILQAAPTRNPVSLAHKVSDKSPERIPVNCLEQSAPFPSPALVDGSQSDPAAFNYSAKMVIGPSHETSEQKHQLTHDAATGLGAAMPL